MIASRLIKASIAASIAIFYFGTIQGDAEVANKASDLDLKWEWPGERRPEMWILVAAISIKKKRDGFFGIGKSPSIAGYLPDAHTMRATVASGPRAGTELQLDLPGLEANRFSAAPILALGLIENKIVICAREIPADVGKEQALDWAKKAGCQT